VKLLATQCFILYQYFIEATKTYIDMVLQG